ncbi:MAG: hypothetical protein RQ754_08380 [Desulfuromonadales bacterium]|nr:hypothetical protein [Desulfuromonadales bacterium]
MILRNLGWGGLLLLILCCLGCSDSSSKAPQVTEAHPENWLPVHGPEATKDVEYASCQLCHGADLRGSGVAPSCFSARIGTQGCHAGGPGAPHPLDGSFLDPVNHGPPAKVDLTVCQGCHGETGGAGDNPRFNVGIYTAGGTGCEAAECHATGYAHPENWAGPNTTFHYSAGNVQAACGLCHGVDLTGGAAPGCLGCHSSVSSFRLDCSFCHELPPDDVSDFAVPIPVAHGNVADIGLHNVCTVCHGMKESAVGGSFLANTNYALFDKSSDTIGDHWNGKINMNADTAYNENKYGCDAAGCHVNDPAHVLSDSGLTVELGAYGSSGSSLPHPVDGTFLSAGNHGPAAEGRTAAFPNGLLDCQPCHGQEGTDNPRFNLGIYLANQEVGCEGCHSEFTAHPSSPSFWYDLAPTHSDIAVTDLGAMCVLCHDTATAGPASGGVGPACSSCHPADPLVSATGCRSCHNQPPDNAGPVGAQRPNRAGSHTEGDHASIIGNCDNCHAGSGFGTAWHFDAAAPADVDIRNLWDADGPGSATYSPLTGDCTNVSCHGGAGNVEGPWY